MLRTEDRSDSVETAKRKYEVSEVIKPYIKIRLGGIDSC